LYAESLRPSPYVKRFALAGLVACAALMVVANAAATPNVANVKTNARGGVLTGSTLAVIVAPQTRVTSFRAWIDITDVTSQFGRQAGIWTAELSTGDLTPGVHHLYVETSGKNGTQDFDTVRLVAGNSNEALLTARRPLVGGAGGAIT